jgi:hypothetical protein
MARSTRTTRRGTGVAVLLALAALGGCSLAEDTASDAADAAKDQAKEQSRNVAAKAVESQICTLVDDGAVSKADVAALERVLDRAHSLGLPDDVLDPAHEIVGNGRATKAEIDRIRGTCP